MSDVKTRFGTVYYDGPCRDNYPNIVERPARFSRFHSPRRPFQIHAAAKLQSPAMRALTMAERRFANRTQRFHRSRAILLDGIGWRSCAEQTKLYASNHSRYAPPAVTGHPRGFCIDVNQNQPDLATINACLAAVGWKQARPPGSASPEPWHWSWGPIV